MNLNFLTEDAKKEFVELYGEPNECHEYDISIFCQMKSQMNFNKIHPIIFEIIDAVYECVWHNFNIDFSNIRGKLKDGKYYYIIVFDIEDIDFAYTPDGESTTTEYGVQVMNEHFKFKDMCKITQHFGDEIEVRLTIEDE